MRMYVGNLAFGTTENDLTRLFSEFGRIESVSLIKDFVSGQSKGFGFVDMPDNSQADVAIKTLNGSSFQGRSIKVNQAEKKSAKKGHAGRKRHHI